MNAEHQDFKTTSYVGTTMLTNHRALLIETIFDQSGGSLQDTLNAQGIELLEVANTAEGLLTKIQKYQPEVLVMSVDFLDATTLDHLIKVNMNQPLPVVVFAKQHAPEVMRTVVDAGVSSYVVDDLQAHRIPVIIDLAMVRFAKMQNLSTELQQTKLKLSERKLIERAKGIIMQQKHLSEKDAYAQMRKSAMNQGQSMADLARRIIDVFEMLG